MTSANTNIPRFGLTQIRILRTLRDAENELTASQIHIALSDDVITPRESMAITLRHLIKRGMVTRRIAASADVGGNKRPALHAITQEGRDVVNFHLARLIPQKSDATRTISTQHQSIANEDKPRKPIRGLHQKAILRILRRAEHQLTSAEICAALPSEYATTHSAVNIILLRMTERGLTTRERGQPTRRPGGKAQMLHGITADGHAAIAKKPREWTPNL